MSYHHVLSFAVSFPVRAARFLVHAYRFVVSPIFGPCCRYHPTCSGYAQEAFGRHGFLKGLYLSTMRVLRCHPWSGRHWNDPVPKRFAWKDILRYNRFGNDDTA